jgi:hypothetical protein
MLVWLIPFDFILEHPLRNIKSQKSKAKKFQEKTASGGVDTAHLKVQ